MRSYGCWGRTYSGAMEENKSEVKDYLLRLLIFGNFNFDVCIYKASVFQLKFTGNAPETYGEATTVNPQYGAAGAPQLFIPGYQTVLKPVFSIPFSK
jgi:hypothetical protein